jgi:branched-chain amino acid transport system ATP-binding protein
MHACGTSIWGSGHVSESRAHHADPLLACDRLCAGWKETQVLNGVSLRLSAGETLVVLGRNGVGKTTLLSTLIGRATHKEGSIRFRGQAIEKLPSYRRARLGMGFVPQEREIFRSLSVQENLAIAARPGAWNLERVFDLFPRLKERRSNGGNQLSGGEQQMLSIARALMSNPKLLLMDEPLEGLAPVIIDQIVEAIHRLRRDTEMAILLVEQHVDIALEFSERIIVLDRGSIAYDNSDAATKPDRAAIEALVSVGA